MVFSLRSPVFVVFVATFVWHSMFEVLTGSFGFNRSLRSSLIFSEALSDSFGYSLMVEG